MKGDWILVRVVILIGSVMLPYRVMQYSSSFIFLNTLQFIVMVGRVILSITQLEFI